jgi:hypothetical protein
MESKTTVNNQKLIFFNKKITFSIQNNFYFL